MEPTKDSINTAAADKPTEEIKSTEETHADAPTSDATMATSISTTKTTEQAQREVAEDFAESSKRFKQQTKKPKMELDVGCPLTIKEFAIALCLISLAGGIGAVIGLMCCSVGASILNNEGNAGYVPSDGTAIGATGGAVWGGVTQAIKLGIEYARHKKITLFNKDNNKDACKPLTVPKVIANLLEVVTLTLASGMIGWGLLNAGDNETEMDFAETVASSAVGSSVIWGSLNSLLFILTQLNGCFSRERNSEPMRKRCLGV